MRIRFIYAGISGVGFNSHGQGDEGSWISHGLCSISAYLKYRGFTDIALWDLRRLGGWHDLYDLAYKDKPDITGIKCMSVDYDYVVKSAQIVKRASPDTLVAVGGPHASIMPQEFEGTGVDVVFRGEGEITFPSLFNLTSEDVRLSKMQVVDGKMPDLDNLPYEDRALFGEEGEQPIAGSNFPRPFVTLIAGRGCKFNCTFCMPAERLIFGQKLRRRSPENVVGELGFISSNGGFASMMIHDDCIDDPDWIEQFCKLYETYSRPFACQLRADFVCRHRESIERLQSVGLRFVIIGFESGSQRVLNFLKKGCTVEQNIEASKILHNLGIGIWANAMFGIPTETPSEMLDTARMLREIRPEHHSLAVYTPHPGSELYRYCKENDLILFNGHAGFRRNIGSGPKIRGVDYEAVNKAVREVYV